jgi:hypothetical protein
MCCFPSNYERSDCIGYVSAKARISRSDIAGRWIDSGRLRCRQCRGSIRYGRSSHGYWDEVFHVFRSTGNLCWPTCSMWFVTVSVIPVQYFLRKRDLVNGVVSAAGDHGGAVIARPSHRAFARRPGAGMGAPNHWYTDFGNWSSGSMADPRAHAGKTHDIYRVANVQESQV